MRRSCETGRTGEVGEVGGIREGDCGISTEGVGVGMSYKYNPLAAAYPSSRGPIGKILRPVVDHRTYLRALHMLLMFPLGIAYFVFLVVSLVVGGVMIWTVVGPLVLVASLFISRWLGDLEALTAAYVNRTPIRRPPSRLEGVSNFRSQVKVRLVDPTTWTGLVYLAAQGPIGVAAFVSLVVVCTVSGMLTFAPAIVAFTDQPLELFRFGDLDATFDTPPEALRLTPFGFLGFMFAVHLVVVFSSIHGWWARLMLGSRSARVSGRRSPTPTGDDEPSALTTSRPGAVTSDPSAELSPRADSKLPESDIPLAILTLVPNQSEAQSGFAANTVAISDLTAREQEVFILAAHGDTNADVAEELFISEGTVKVHVKRIYSKLDVRDRAQLVVFAYKHRLVIPESSDVTSVPKAERSRLVDAR